MIVPSSLAGTGRFTAPPDVSGITGSSMARRTPATFAKRQREMDKKRWAEEKRKKKAERRDADPLPPGEEPPYEVCRPITDE
jgi:hypothetical protein